MSEWSRQNRETIRFCLLFAIYLTCFSLFVELEWMKAVFIPELSKALANAAYWVLNKAGMHAVLSGVVVFQKNGFAVEITNTCSGIIQVCFLLAGVLAFPVNWRYKFIGASLGSVAILVINLLRIVGLFLVGVYARSWFDFVHRVLGEIGMIATTFLIWFAWAMYVRRAGISNQESA